MGSDKKEKKRRRDSSSDSDSDSSREKKKSSKKDKKKEKKHKKEKKSKDKGGGGKCPVDPISKDDYFQKNPEFRLWLASRGKVFGDLSDSDTKELFVKFVKKWNAGDLSDKLYQGVTFSDLSGQARTSHKWGFAKKIDNFASDTLKDQVLADTQSTSLLLKPGQVPKPQQGPQMAGGGGGMNTFESEELREQRRAAEQLERKKLKRDRKEDMEELAPRPDPGSFQARMEKRAQKGHYCRERGESPELKQSDVMGGGGDEIKERLMRQQSYKQQAQDKKQMEQRDKLAAYNQKEKEKMNEFRKMMGLPEEQ